ncbi:UNVERIFIED_CONTAM: Tryptophan synthase beta chain 2, chloroplastic [Sesamum radiatum]|uniref:tryptophan synthase n=1 Tax=Sesamum radiatum TaxID=300843 RepID=A0AAW2KJ02_SESRA
MAACTNYLLTLSFHHANSSSISIPKFSTRLHFNQPSRVVENISAQITCSATTSSNNHMTRTSNILGLIDQADAGLSSTGKFGRFGGVFVPETLVSCLNKLAAEFNFILHDPQFQGELAVALRDYVGRETPLYFAQRLTDHYKNSSGEGPGNLPQKGRSQPWRSTQNQQRHCSGDARQTHGRKSVVAATGAGQHGVATAAVCAKLSLDCSIFMGNEDEERQTSNVLLMKHLGARVKTVEGTFKDATSEAIRNWVEDLDSSYYLAGTAVGPHPCPSMVREFQSVIGKETRKQAMEKWGGKPDVLVACVGSGSNALGMFHEFVRDEDVRLIGVEAAGSGIDSGKHSATLSKGEIGVYHGAMSYLLQDDEGQIIGPHSIGVGLEYPGVSPELSFLKDIGRAEFHTVTDEEALMHMQCCAD